MMTIVRSALRPCRLAPPAIACLVLSGIGGAAIAAEPGDAMAVPGACYVLSNPKGAKGRLFERIELQMVQVTPKAGPPTEASRVHIGIQPRGGDDVIPSALSEPCTGTAPKLACRIACETKTGAASYGSFRIAPSGKERLKLTIETPLTLNVCAAGEIPVALPKALAGKSFTLRLATASNCFH